MLIRRAIPSDAATIAHLGRRTFIDTFARFNRPDDMSMYLDRTYSEELQRREIGDPAWTTLLAEDEGRAVGFAQLRDDGPRVEVARLYVDAPWHGRGVARALMDEIERLAREQARQAIWLGVWEHNARAIRFYEKCGFRDTGSHPFILGTDLQTDRVMTKEL